MAKLRGGTTIGGNLATHYGNFKDTLTNSTSIALTGDVTGTGNFDAAGALSITTVVGNDSHTHADLTNATSANTVSRIVKRDAAGNFSAGVITATATTARYADLAENYSADATYESGTVLEIGGEYEVTLSTTDESYKVVGVVTTNPAHLMNSDIEAEFVAAIALQGRVPCKVIGPVSKGDIMVSAGNGMARATTQPKAGTIIGKSLENFTGTSGVIEVLVGVR